MKRTALAFSCLLLSMTAEAQLYQYKDAAGRTVYSDQPPASGATRSRTIAGEAAAPSAPTAPAAASKSTAERELEFKKRQKEQQEAAAKESKEAAGKAARKEDCERARRYLELMESGERVAMRDDQGERVYLEDNQRAAEAERARKSVADLCK